MYVAIDFLNDDGKAQLNFECDMDSHILSDAKFFTTRPASHGSMQHFKTIVVSAFCFTCRYVMYRPVPYLHTCTWLAPLAEHRKRVRPHEPQASHVDRREPRNKFSS